MPRQVAKAAASIFSSGLTASNLQAEVMHHWLQKSETSMKAGTGKQATATGWLLVLSRVFQEIHAQLRPKLLGVAEKITKERYLPVFPVKTVNYTRS